MVTVFSRNQRIKIQFFYPSFPLPKLKQQLQTTSLKRPLKYLADALEVFLGPGKRRASPSYTIQMEMVTNKKMKQINDTHRGKNRPTDVLSFPFWDDLKEAPSLSEIPLGDLVVSLEILLEQSREFHLSPLEEFYHLVFHGFLHLWGYDHERSRKEEILMEKKEAELIKILKKVIARGHP